MSTLGIILCRHHYPRSTSDLARLDPHLLEALRAVGLFPQMVKVFEPHAGDRLPQPLECDAWILSGAPFESASHASWVAELTAFARTVVGDGGLMFALADGGAFLATAIAGDGRHAVPWNGVMSLAGPPRSDNPILRFRPDERLYRGLNAPRRVVACPAPSTSRQPILMPFLPTAMRRILARRAA